MFNLTNRQQQANNIFCGNATYNMAFGGSRSGKTFYICRAIALRAIKAKNSRHAILRFRFNHIKQSIVLDTFPKMMRLAFPNFEYKLNKTDFYAYFPYSNSEIWFGGLDDSHRVEKILGNEYATIYLNECSQIKWDSVEMVQTRLAQQCYQEINGVEVLLKNKMFFDCNPPTNSHWSYSLFIKHLHPTNKNKHLDPSDYVSIQMNPQDNVQNLSPDYLKTLEGLSGHNKQRFLFGEFTDANPNALWNFETIDKWRVID